MIVEMSKAYKQYTTKELCELLKLPRSSYYYPNTGLMFKKAKNLLNREFEQQSINTHWVGDILFLHSAINDY